MSVQRIYQISLIILGLMALFLAIPSITDTLLMKGTFLGGYLSMGYVFLWFLSSLNGVVRKAVVVTWLGLFSFIFAMLPLFSTIYNVILIFVTIIFLVKDFKAEMLEKEEAKNNRLKAKKEPTVFDVFGKDLNDGYEEDEDDD